ncbi:NQR2, RnfD, RnfE family [Sinosporangium album]|uniref:NQR2, RnfD, RnfE family n=1 Tax=Sinosporangium album TaxID=504805 RepID=A0A1G8F2P7_9ACTN|nr:RnfABCDGE type electron transport complex subunit D [Sinosporangium album]SDH76400.1 NQR2, RnfD, RnfE family [Sinosporangium album]
MTTTALPTTPVPVAAAKRGLTPQQKRSKALRRFAGSITLATVLGHTVLGFEQAYITPVVGVLVGLLTEFVLETVEAWAHRRPARYRGRPGETVDFFLPSYIGGLACAMLLYGNSHLMPTVLAVVVGVGSKYVFRVNGKHFLNPSNLGIAAVLVLFPWVSIAPPYQFTEWVSGPIDALVPLVVLVLGTMLNAKLTGKLPLILGWLAGFAAQAVLRGLFTDVSMVSALLPMTGVAFILYTNYMITDPGTTPWKPLGQVAFGVSVAAVYGLLVELHIVFGLFFALVLVCIGRGAGLAVLARYRRAAAAVPAEPVLTGARP